MQFIGFFGVICVIKKRLMKLIISAFLLLTIGYQTEAQNLWYNLPEDSLGSVSYESEPLVDSLFTHALELNKQDSMVDGFRIQIFYGSKRSGATELQTVFNDTQDSLKAYLVYQQPYWKVHTGDFRNRWDAEKWAEILNKEYPGAFVVPTKVHVGVDAKAYRRINSPR